jgi:hypothetical protein
MGKSKELQDLIRRLPAEFPRLAGADCEKTSEESRLYNCIAHAADDQSRKWDCPPMPVPGYYWPPGAKTGNELDALVSAFESIGYNLCDNPGLEEGYEKVVLYTDRDGLWTHAAKQREVDGHWSSKLGDLIDIRHASADDVGGPAYGEPVCYMKRKKSPPQHNLQTDC